MSPLFLLVLACVSTPDDTVPPAADPPLDTEATVDTEPAVDTDDTEEPPLPTWTVTLTPAAPRFDEDLRCVVTDLAEGESVSLSWTVDGAPYTGHRSAPAPATEIVAHTDQAGGQRWECAATSTAGATVRSATVVIAPILPMGEIPPGTRPTASLAFRQEGMPVTITRPFLMAATELTVGTFREWTGYVPSEMTPVLSDQHPVTRTTLFEAMWFANVLSEADGLPPCFDCVGVGPDAICTRPPDPYACQGYRLPTYAEFEHAYHAAGAHEDMLPAGGNWTPDEFYEERGDVYDPPVWGPNAPLDSTIGSQCWFSFNSRTVIEGVERASTQQVGLKLPTEQGIFDLCGNVKEYIVDSSIYESEYYDPFYNNYDENYYIGSNFTSRTSNIYPVRSYESSTYGTESTHGGVRIVRTLVHSGGLP